MASNSDFINISMETDDTATDVISSKTLSNDVHKYMYDSSDIDIDISLNYRNQFTTKINNDNDEACPIDKPQSLFGAYKYNIKLSMPNGQSVNIQKRYSDLEGLYTTLSARFPFIILPSFPPKTLFINYKKDEEKLKARGQALQVFFKKLMTNNMLNNAEFLSVVQEYKSENRSPSTILVQSATCLLELINSHK